MSTKIFKHTNSSFIEAANKVHDNFYKYHKVNYVKAAVKVEIECPFHSYFWQAPANHLQGAGCPQCYKNSRGKSKLEQSKVKFLRFLSEEYTRNYDTSKIDYRGTKQKVVLVCPTHGDFLIQVDSIYKQCGCEKCAREERFKPFDYFHSKFVLKHKNKYEYNESTFVDSQTKMEIICQEHGAFLQSPHSHARGEGCPACAKTGYKKDKAGTFYILQYENMTKIGITNREVKSRISQIKENTGKQFKVFCQFNFQDGNIPAKIERELLKYFNTLFEKPQTSFDGSTECYIDADPWFVMDETLKLLENLNDNQK